jgi:hypothetical protein
MKRTLLILGLIVTQSALGQSPQYKDQPGLYEGVNILRGFVLSGYRVDPHEDVDTGFGVDLNYTSVALNGGVATKKFGDSPIRPSERNDPDDVAAEERVNNAYFGVGFSRVLQFQYGYGNHGSVVRLRSDFNYRAISDFFSNRRTPKRQLTLADRITFTFAVENYNDTEEEAFDNFTWGIGLLF